MANNLTLSYPSAFHHQFFDRNGKPLTDGKLYTYSAGTSTPIPTYKTIGDTSSTNTNTNPIILDNAGMAYIVIEKDKAYKFVLFDKNDAKIAEWDNVTGNIGGGGGGSEDIVVVGTPNEIDVREEGLGLIRRFIVSLSDYVKNVVANKKDKQQNNDTSSTATKTLTRITQDTNGVIYPHFDDIEFPEQVQADFEQNDPLKKDFIKNKPEITKWVSVDKSYFGSMNVGSGAGNAFFKINKSLLLLELSFWFNFGDYSNQIRKGFVFNNDIPLSSATAGQDCCFFGDVLGKTDVSGDTKQYPILASVRPYNDLDPLQKMSICVRPSGMNVSYSDSFYRIFPIKRELIEYLENKGVVF